MVRILTAHGRYWAGFQQRRRVTPLRPLGPSGRAHNASVCLADDKKEILGTWTVCMCQAVGAVGAVGALGAVVMKVDIWYLVSLFFHSFFPPVASYSRCQRMI
ncbi:uncharacterized protein GGS25DRAFT_122403 [Hypoxylon fragiforme]|uniref:uncharacterized protein n=1 Tax=Hypoxylon fragiforme TaxID=63214 RepID=UPI0020C611EF|nr:uncharacterized protein GGS25DRAFT_122403 [Hypoxylon fragiforme]KAI2612511.1 hypothetical protein GGS25DRAFT_122403 [Hypoxylon fragiforme]